MKRFYLTDAPRRSYDPKMGPFRVKIDRQSVLTKEEQIEAKLFRHYGPWPNNDLFEADPDIGTKIAIQIAELEELAARVKANEQE